MLIMLLICLLFLGLTMMMTIAHMPRAKEVEFKVSFGFFNYHYKVKFHKKKMRT